MTDIISICVFGIESKSFVKSDNPEIRTMGEQLCHRNFATRFSSLIFTFLPFLKFLFRNRYVPKKVENYFVKEISRIIKEREEEKIDVQDFLEYVIGKRNRNEITDFDVAAHTVTFFSDGLETTSTTLAYALYEVKITLLKIFLNDINFHSSWAKILQCKINYELKLNRKRANFTTKKLIKWFIWNKF